MDTEIPTTDEYLEYQNGEPIAEDRQESTPESTAKNSGGRKRNRTDGGKQNSETELEPPKQKRGRPKGSKNKSSKTSFILQEEEIGQSHTAGLNDSSNEVKYKQTRKKIEKFMSKEEAENASQFILGLSNDLAVEIMGDDAGMNMLESSLLKLALPEYLASMELKTIEKTKSIAYPIMLIGGLSMWGLRLLAIANEKRKENNKQKQQNSEQQFTENNTQQQTEVYNGVDVNLNNRESSEINWKNKQYNPMEHINGF